MVIQLTQIKTADSAVRHQALALILGVWEQNDDSLQESVGGWTSDHSH